MAEKLLVQLEDSVGNIYYLHTSADVVFCEDGISVQTKLAQKIEKADIIQNATTASTTKVVSASVAKNLQDQINEQNTNMKQGGIRLIPWDQVNSSTINFADYSHPLKIFWINGWDSSLKGLTPTPNSSDFWCVLHIPCCMNITPSSDDISYIKQIWLGLSGNRLFTRSYWKTKGWNTFVEK